MLNIPMDTRPKLAPVIYLVDDDDDIRVSFAELVQAASMDCRCYATAQPFLDNYDSSRPGCLVLDLRMPGIDGLELQRILAERAISIPTIILTGHGTVDSAVTAMRGGAYDFVQKPCSGRELIDRIRAAVEIDVREREAVAEVEDRWERYASLTPREKQVLERLVRGLSGKAIANDLGISVRTQEKFRAKVMKKMSVENPVELTRVCLSLGVVSGRDD